MRSKVNNALLMMGFSVLFREYFSCPLILFSTFFFTDMPIFFIILISRVFGLFRLRGTWMRRTLSVEEGNSVPNYFPDWKKSWKTDKTDHFFQKNQTKNRPLFQKISKKTDLYQCRNPKQMKLNWVKVGPQESEHFHADYHTFISSMRRRRNF